MKLNDLNLIFSTPIWSSLVDNHKEVNEKLMKYIDQLQSTDPEGKFKSNIKGWHSQNFDLKADAPVFFLNSISKILNKSFFDMGWDLEKNKIKITGMWTIINPPGASNSRHIHSNNFISAAYYIKAPKNSGKIVFYDPRDANVIRKPVTKTENQLNADIFYIQPQEGLLVLFPSYLHHSVDQNSSEDERIVLSFNVNLTF